MAEQVGALLFAITQEALAIASNDVQGAVAYAAAIAAATAGIAKTAIEFDVESKSGTGGGSGGSRGANVTRTSAQQSDTRQPYVININGTVAGHGAMEDITRLSNDYARAY